MSLIFSKKICFIRRSISNIPIFNKKFLRKCSDKSVKFQTFDEVIAQRRSEAQRSIVVQVYSESSFNELYNYCSKYALINGIHHYKNSVGEHFMLIEFGSNGSVKTILQSCSSHHKDLDITALQSPFLWFRAVSGVKKEKLIPITKPLQCKEGIDPVNEDKLFEDLRTCATVSEQIQLLYDRTVLNDLGIRLRFMVARQLEWIFKSLYANIAVNPFGSSVNGFGKMGCDLDLVVTNVLTDEMTDQKKRLVFQEKKVEGGRSPWQRHMELIGDILELRVPGASRVHRILNARVPIVKYAHELTDVDCDLCFSNVSGVYMSELLWLYGSLDPRVRPLAFVVRSWAKTVGLTNLHPGRWITNFPLTLMVVFFLQQKSSEGAVLPTLKYLTKQAGKEDIRIAEDKLDCTFLRDLNKLPLESYGQNPASLEKLLLQFFEFYSQFNFQDKAISIFDGSPIRKPNNVPLYIVNPLEQALNVSRNVSYEECERLKLEVRNAAWHLEENERSEDWGILSLLEKKTARGLKNLIRTGNSHRLVLVKDLFNNEDLEEPTELRNKLKSLTQKSDSEIEKNVKEMKVEMEKVNECLESAKNEKGNTEKIRFKNRQVANEVMRIRRNKLS